MVTLASANPILRGRSNRAVRRSLRGKKK